eukprot:GFYU01009386.1.p1 GENE.GFYU01009386.1~~GFYU01009386.1.p1  ORF type:complete len:915 (+),score=221.10 GFYU01009386.1:235-2979(+)
MSLPLAPSLKLGSNKRQSSNKTLSWRTDSLNSPAGSAKTRAIQLIQNSFRGYKEKRRQRLSEELKGTIGVLIKAPPGQFKHTFNVSAKGMSKEQTRDFMEKLQCRHGMDTLAVRNSAFGKGFDKSEKDGREELADLIRHHARNLRVLDLSNCNLKNKGAEILSTAIHELNNCVIEVLDVSNNQIGDAGMTHVGEMLKVNKSIKSLTMARNQIKADGFHALVLALELNSTLDNLNLADNQIGDDTERLLELLGGFWQRVRLLGWVNLNLQHNNIHDRGGLIIIKILNCSPSLERLNIEGNRVAEKTGPGIVAQMERNKTVQYLNIRNTGIGAKTCSYMIDGLFHNTSLTEFNIGHNPINSDSLHEVLSKALLHEAKKPSPLAIIDLSGLELSEAVMDDVVQLIRRPRALVKRLGKTEADYMDIVMKCCTISPKSMQMLSRCWRKCTPSMPLVICLDATALGDEGVKQVCKAIAAPTCMTESLSMQQCNITAVGAKEIARALNRTTILRSLNLAHNDMKDEGIQLIAKSLQHYNRSVRSLDITDNNATPAIKNCLSGMLRWNGTISYVNIGIHGFGRDTSVRTLDTELKERPFTRRTADDGQTLPPTTPRGDGNLLHLDQSHQLYGVWQSERQYTKHNLVPLKEMVLWLRANVLVDTLGARLRYPQISADEAENVELWRDMSQSYNHMGQDKRDRQPVHIPALPALKFNGREYLLSDPVQLFATDSSAITMAALFTVRNSTDWMCLFNNVCGSRDENRALEVMMTVSHPNCTIQLHRGDKNATVATTQLPDQTVWLMIEILGDKSLKAPDNVRITVNGETLTAAVQGGGWCSAGTYPTDRVPVEIGGKIDGKTQDATLEAHRASRMLNGFRGDISEFIIWKGQLSGLERAAVVRYMGKKKKDLLIAQKERSKTFGS